MREIRYFGLNQWGEMRGFMQTLLRSRGPHNIVARVDSKKLRYVVEWDEQLINLENK